jgi:sporulation protein YlmC with PRC-barrel domain
MRLSDLLHEPVFDSDWRPIGRVHDVRLVQDGPLQGLVGAAFRVDGLVVGRSAYGVRFGFHRRNMRGPWPLKVLFERLERRVHYVPWEDVESYGTDGVHARVPLAELGPPPPVS